MSSGREFKMVWFLSSLNVLVIAVVVGSLYILYRRWRGKRRAVTYRSLEMKKASEGKVNALVTGGNGRLGREMVQCLLEDGGYNVHSLDLLLPEDTNCNTEVCQYIQADITNYDDLLVAFKGINVVFHVAGVVPLALSNTHELMKRVNIGGTENVIKASKECHVKRLIYTSSVSVILSKDPNQIIDRADESYPYPDEPYTPYCATKGAAERAVRKANGTDGLLTCALRPGGLVSAAYVKLVISELSYMDEGANIYPYVPIRAVADAHLLVDKKLSKEGMDSVAAGSAYNLCLDEMGTQRETHELFASIVGTKATSVSSSLVRVLAYINTLVYQLTGVCVISLYLSTETFLLMNRSYCNTFSSARAHQELGWPELPPWREVFVKATKECMEEKKAK